MKIKIKKKMPAGGKIFEVELEDILKNERREFGVKGIYHFGNFEFNGIKFNDYASEVDEVNLMESSFVNCDFSGVVFKNCNFSDSVFKNCRLDGAKFFRCQFENANFKENGKIDFFKINFSQCSFYSCKFEEAVNTKLILPSLVPFDRIFIGYKRAGDYIIKLRIPLEAKKSSGTTRKCRTSKAKVLEILDMNCNVLASEVRNAPNEITVVNSTYDPSFLYELGYVVKVEDFDDNRWHECSTGIHFFLTFDEARNYKWNDERTRDRWLKNRE